MTEIDPNLLAAAGFVGAGAQQNVASAKAKNTIDQAQIGLQGEQKRQSINDNYENSGMYNSSRRNLAITQQGADQANRSAMADLGMNDTIANANISVMQEVARQKLQEQELAQQRQLFDQQIAYQRGQVDQGPDVAAIEAYLRSLYPQAPQPSPNLDQSAGMEAWRNVHSRGW